MPLSSRSEADPWDWSLVIAAFFLALVWHRIGMPTSIYFDEVHYVPAARKLLHLQFANPEHPMLAKELIAASIAVLGDTARAWRLPSALFGALGLYAFARVLWLASFSRFATLSGQFLLATGFSWFVQSRIAMLDMVMAGLAMTALWMLAAAMRHPKKARWRLAVAGLCLGMSLAAKWSVAPLALLPGLVFAAGKLRDCGRRFLIEKSGGPVPGISLIEAALWLGLIPLAVYWTTYAPAFFYAERAVSPWGIIEQHRYMLQLQDSVRKPHPYRTVWYQWASNWRGLWYLYREIDDAWRGVLMIGNPFTDVPELCSQAIVMTDNAPEVAQREAVRLAEMFWPERHRMQGKFISLERAIQQARTMKGPVLFTDAADATSSGASGDSNLIIKAVREMGYPGRVLAQIVDEPAVRAAHKAGVGAEIEVDLGGSLLTAEDAREVEQLGALSCIDRRAAVDEPLDHLLQREDVLAPTDPKPRPLQVRSGHPRAQRRQQRLESFLDIAITWRVHHTLKRSSTAFSTRLT